MKPKYCSNAAVTDCGECSLSNYGRDCRNNPVEPEPEKMDEQTFRHLMMSAKALETGDYLAGYRYGLRRCYHGEQFGEAEQFDRMRERCGELAEGLRDGLAGLAPQSMREGCGVEVVDGPGEPYARTARQAAAEGEFDGNN